MTVTGPDFIALQVSDLERSAEFYENALGLRRAPASPPGAVLFTTAPIPFAVREPFPDPAPSPFGLMFTFADPDGYAVTVHEKAS